MTQTTAIRRSAQVIGDPIEQSKSPLIHNFWLEQLGLPPLYSKAHVPAVQLKDYLLALREDPERAGCNVTMPHKQAVLDHLDTLDPLAERLGAVNTIVRLADGTLHGMNTDAGGFLEPILPMLEQRHLFRMARIIGTGGAARAIIAALADKGFTLVVAGRDMPKARAILDELAPGGEHYAADLSQFATRTDFAFDDRQGCLDLVINASSLGMIGQAALAFDWTHAPPRSVAYDIVTSPVETPFLKKARARGHTTIDGLAMLVGQAALAFEKFFGVAPPRDHDADLLQKLNP